MRWPTRDAILVSFLLASSAACSGDDTSTPSGPSDASTSSDASTTPGTNDGAAPADGSTGATDATTGDAGATDAQSGPFALTSTGLDEAAAFPSTFTCAGANVSPPLAWTGAPAATKSYAIVFTDVTKQLVHWVIWDIPAATTSLAQDVPKQATPATPAGAKQSTSYDNTTHGYLGPCPNGAVHTYELALYAVDVATLPGVTTDTARNTVRDTILQHDLATAKLSGTSDAKK